MSWFSKGEKTIVVFLCSLALVGAGIRLLIKFSSDEVVVPVGDAPGKVDRLSKMQKSAESPINLNKAPAARLSRLQGIGPSNWRKG